MMRKNPETNPKANPNMMLTLCSVFLVTSAILSSAALGQDQRIPDDEPAGAQTSTQPAGQTAPQTMTFGELYASIEKAEPLRRSGLRSSLLSQSMQVVPVIVIVETAGAYLDAIAGWEGPLKYPVLFDDGTDLSREHIARFVRGFGPSKVVRVQGDGQGQWPKGDAQRQDAINASLAASLQENEADWVTTLANLKQTGVVSPGVVVIDPSGPHWASGLALAAGRMQPVLYMSGPSNPYAELEPGAVLAMNQAIEQGLRRLGLEFDSIGDDVDTITLAMRLGIKIRTGPGERDRLATTDQIGRSDASLGGQRWAWCGQMFGTTSTTVYQAMCSLFMNVESALVWDGYPNTGDWRRYDGTAASRLLEQAEFEVELFDEPRNSLAGFKGRGASGPVDASLILMNSKGTHSNFDLPMAPSGQGKPGDLPILGVPAMLHMVHSFSLSIPRSPLTVGGRWMERGVYLYAGSVDEPFLTGFVPTPIVTQRLLGRLAFAAAVHYDDGQAWKIAVIGDPLKTLSPSGRMLDVIPGPVRTMIDGWGGVYLGERAKEKLKERKYSAGIEDLILTGQDAAVVRLARAMLTDKPEAVDDDGAKLMLQAAFREGEHELVLDCYERLSAESRSDRLVLDTMWMAGRYRLNRFQDGRALALMRVNLREQQVVEDGEELAQFMRRDSLENAIGFMESLRPKVNGTSRTRALNTAIDRLKR
ncbi:MAG: hypothetical protein AB8C13_02935 [Phycisphaerales bacterium]